MAFPPNLFLIGAQKAGTTFLANILDQHPEICVSDPKEPGYLIRNYSKGLDWYKSRFSNHQAAYLLDATPGYTAAHLDLTDEVPSTSPYLGIPERLKEVSPNAFLIYLVRDPVDRTYSSYWHNVRAGRESRSFRQAIDEDSYYLRVSRYCDQLALYRQHFPLESFLILEFGDLVRKPLDTVGRCLTFLTLAPLSTVKTDQGKNRSFTYPPGLSQLNRALSPIGGLGRIAKLLKPLIPSRLKTWLYNDIARKIPAMSLDDRDYLAAYFERHNQDFAAEYGFDIRKWHGPLRENVDDQLS